jgi:flagellar hook-associated protein 3 FlgL
VTDTILNQLQQGSINQSNLQTQISTGLRISQPSDDPSAYGRVLVYQTSQREVARYAKNAAAALAVSQATYAGLQSVNAVAGRAGELAVLGASTLGATSMQSYAVEVNQLIEQAVQIGNTKYNNNYLFAGTAVDSPPFTVARDADGRITGVTYGGNDSQTSIPLSSGSQVAPSTTGATNTGIETFITQLIALRDALNSGDTGAVNATQAGLTDSGNLIISAIAETGGVQTRIEAAQSDLQSRSATLDTLISNEDSTDITTAVVKLSQAQTAYQAALASASQVMNTSLLDYLQ